MQSFVSRLRIQLQRPSFIFPSRKRAVDTAIVALLAAWWWVAHTSFSIEKPPTTAVHVTVAPVVRKSVPVDVSLVGTVVPYETVAIKSRLDSQIIEVRFHDGDYVTEGQTLFVLDDRAIKAQIGQLEAALAKEKAQLVNTKLQYERTQRLLKSHVVADAQADDAKAAYEAQLAQVNAAQANLDNQRVQLTYTVINAPVSGRTGTINVTRGNNVKANDTQALVTINQVTPIRVQFAVPQRYYGEIRNALQQGNVSVEAHEKESKVAASGKIEYVDNAIDVSNGSFAVRAVFPNTDEKLWPGMFVNVTVELGVEKNVLTVPAVAVQGDENNHFVFAVASDAKEGKKAVRKPVQLSLNNSDIAVITSGLKDGDEVITDGILRVTDGAQLDISPTPVTGQQNDSATGAKSPGT